MDPREKQKWKVLKEKVAAAEQEAISWRQKFKQSQANLKAASKQEEASARAVKLALRGAHGGMVLELEKLKSAFLIA